MREHSFIFSGHEHAQTDSQRLPDEVRRAAGTRSFPSAPPVTAVGHVRFFGCPVDFRCDMTGLASAAKVPDVRLRKGDPVMARYAHQYLASIREHPHATTAEKVRQFVRAL